MTKGTDMLNLKANFIADAMISVYQRDPMNNIGRQVVRELETELLRASPPIKYCQNDVLLNANDLFMPNRVLFD
jgi:hypothetical protein